MAVGARTDNSQDLLKKLAGEISNLMAAPDANLSFLQQLHQTVIGELRAPIDRGYQTGMLGSGPMTDPSAAPGGPMPPQNAVGMAGLMAPSPSPSASPLAALLSGGGAPGGNLRVQRPQPTSAELQRVLSRVA
jgi:hypothetical protein